jgi:hypothetical protein
VTGRLPKITVSAWDDQEGGHALDGSEIDPLVPTDTYVTWTPDTSPDDDSTVNRPNVRTQIVADNAIDEEAIQVDSVTYEEISSSAVAEIVNGVWNANIWQPMETDLATLGSTARADTGSMGHAALLQYISQNLLHYTAVESDMTGFHHCSSSSLDGTRFYTGIVPGLAGTDQQNEYIDKSVVIIKGWTMDGHAPDGDEEVYLARISDVVPDDGTGAGYFEIHLVNEDQDPIPGGLVANDATMIVKALVDSTMHEVAHEVWEESVFDHETADTFGMFSRIMTGLTQFNHRITDSIYDDSGRLLSCRLVVYPSSEDAKNKTNALTTVEVTSAYDEKQNMETFLAKEE